MRILFQASHLLHWRALLPVADELWRRGHEITFLTTRPDWLGLPRYAMRYDPKRVDRINRSALFWLSTQLLHDFPCVRANIRVCFKQSTRPSDHDRVVSTVKNMASLRSLPNSVALGYQHLPGVFLPRGMSNLGTTYFPVFHAHPFATYHGFESVIDGCLVTPAGFTHLDAPRCLTVNDQESRLTHRRTCMIVHPGGSRGVRGHRWLQDTVRVLNEAGQKVIIAAHPIPGVGARIPDLRRAVRNLDAEVTRGWWPRGLECDAIFALGSSSLYEVWSLGLTNGYILTYPDGSEERASKFAMFEDIKTGSLGDLAAFVKEGKWTRPLRGVTAEVAWGFARVHDGHAVETACQVIEEGR